MTERVGVTRTVDLRSILADRPDILLRLIAAQEIYVRHFQTGEITLEEAGRIVEAQIISGDDDELLAPNHQFRGANILSVLRTNIGSGSLLELPEIPQVESQSNEDAPEDISEAA